MISLRENLLTYYSDKLDDELIERVKTMRNEEMSIDDIAAFNSLSIREVVDILGL